MLPFPIALKAGESPYRQVVFAATKAVLSGMLPAGSPFPSVRELSQSLKINPNTAHKVVAELVRDGLLQVMPGLGTVVAAPRTASRSERAALLADPVEQLVVEARRVGLARQDVLDAIETRWTQLFGDDADPSRTTGDDRHADATHGDANDE
ncbi:MAG: GntR family transcriptional regulator [Gemmatimonadota bacterium]